MMANGHSSHGSATGAGGISSGWSSPPVGFRATGHRPITDWSEYGVHLHSPITFQRVQQKTDAPSWLARPLSPHSGGIRFDNHSTHKTHPGLTSELSSDGISNFQNRSPPDSRFPYSVALRSQAPSAQTPSSTSRIHPLDSSGATLARPSLSARYEQSILSTIRQRPLNVSGTRQFPGKPLEHHSAIGLPTTRGLEDSRTQSHKVPTTQPTFRLSKSTGT